jgi:hypothetical protein
MERIIKNEWQHEIWVNSFRLNTWRPRQRSEDNITFTIKVSRHEDVNWIQLAQDRVKL